MLSTHGSSGVQLLGTYANFCAQAKLVAVCETGASVPVDGCAVDLLYEFECFAEAGCEDAIAVVAAVLVDVGDGFVDA